MYTYNTLVFFMKRISINNYNLSMGKLIDVQDSVSYNELHYPGSINIPYDTLMLNHKDLLSKNESYFIICRKGHKSRRAVNMLEFYGYNVTQVYYE